jgi:hypothetical protein
MQTVIPFQETFLDERYYVICGSILHVIIISNRSWGLYPAPFGSFPIAGTYYHIFLSPESV